MIGMTENGDPYENAVAESINGILKTERISGSYSDIGGASIHISRDALLFTITAGGPQASTGRYLEAHTPKGPQLRRWKNYYQNDPKKKEVTMPKT